MSTASWQVPPLLHLASVLSACASRCLHGWDPHLPLHLAEHVTLLLTADRDTFLAMDRRQVGLAALLLALAPQQEVVAAEVGPAFCQYAAYKTLQVDSANSILLTGNVTNAHVYGQMVCRRC